MSHPFENRSQACKGYEAPPQFIPKNKKMLPDLLASEICNDLTVFEYLESRGLERTLTTFLEETTSKKSFLDRQFPVTFMESDSQKLIFEYFDNGSLKSFLKEWKVLLKRFKSNNSGIAKLEVNLRLHFAAFPFRNGGSEIAKRQAMDDLRAYFEDKKNNFSDENNDMSLLAIPYLPDPFQTQEFHHIIQPGWSEKLRFKLQCTIAKCFQELRETNSHKHDDASLLNPANFAEDTSVLPTQLTTSEVRNNNYYQKRFFQLLETFRKIRRLLRGTRESYGKLLKIANILICGFEASVSGRQEILGPVIIKCYGIFPELFVPEEGGMMAPDSEYFKQLANGAFFDSVLDSDVSLFFIGVSDMSPEYLDYPKIKRVLSDPDSGNADQLCLLQALRWLLTRSPSSCKGFAMEAFINSDLLGLTAANGEHRKKLFSRFVDSPGYLKECLLRFLNCIATLKAGRRYLSSSTYIIDILSLALGRLRNSEEYNCQMIIAIFQKLSLRKSMRLGIIKLGVIQWLVNYIKPRIWNIENSKNLDQSQSTPDWALPSNYPAYLMEYAWALLMNLCLHEEAAIPVVEIGRTLIDCAIKMIRIQPTVDVTPYIISTLYSLVQNPLILPIASDLNLAAQLTEIVKNGYTSFEGEIQLGRVIRILEGGDLNDRHKSEVDYDDDDQIDQDEFEIEIEVPETWVQLLGKNHLVGDDLLSRKYLLQNPTGESILPDVEKTRLSVSNLNDIIIRPTTPSTLYKLKSYPVSKESTPYKKQESTERNEDNVQNGHPGLNSSIECESIHIDAISRRPIRTSDCSDTQRTNLTSTAIINESLNHFSRKQSDNINSNDDQESVCRFHNKNKLDGKCGLNGAGFKEDSVSECKMEQFLSADLKKKTQFKAKNPELNPDCLNGSNHSLTANTLLGTQGAFVRIEQTQRYADIIASIHGSGGCSKGRSRNRASKKRTSQNRSVEKPVSTEFTKT